MDRGHALILRTFDGPALDGLRTRQGRLAFWINTYNTLVVDGIVALGIRKSVWEVPEFFERISCRIDGLVFSAEEIEHGVLRGNRASPLPRRVPFAEGDPRMAHAIRPPDVRIHFAINCGARSCPVLHRYDPALLDAQLDAATRAFINHRVGLEGERLAMPLIFEWFRTDFDELPAGLAGFLSRYLEDGPARHLILERGVDAVAWRPWDWRLPDPVPAVPSRAEQWTARG